MFYSKKINPSDKQTMANEVIKSFCESPVCELRFIAQFPKFY